MTVLRPHTNGHFSPPGQATNKLLKAALPCRVPLGYAFAALYLVLARPASNGFFLLVSALVILGCAIRTWAAGHLSKGERVAVGGPYAFVRNPLYLGSFIIGAGFCVALWSCPVPVTSVILWAVYLVSFAVIYTTKTKAEERELCLTLNGEYQSYASKVPSFLPWKGRVRDLGSQPFSYERFLRNREYQCLLGSAGVLAILFVKLQLPG